MTASAIDTSTVEDSYAVTVSYVNRGTTSCRYTFEDWSAEDSGGKPARLDGDVNVGFGSIAPGDSRSGRVIFSAAKPLAKVSFQPSTDATVTVWVKP